MSRKDRQRQKQNQAAPATPTPPKHAFDAMKVFAAEDKLRTAEIAKIATRDGFDNFVSRIGLNNNNALSASTYEFNMMTKNRIRLEAAYRGSWVVGQVIDLVADDMTRAGINITTNEAEEDIKDLQSAISKKRIWHSLSLLEKWGRLYGGAIAVLQIKGQDLSSPLDPERIGKDQFQGLVIYDRWQLNPDLTNVIKDGPDMGLPEFYQIVNNPANPGSVSVNVHHSRCIRNIGIELPYFQAITEMMWGESILERLWDRLIAFDNATMSSAQLIDRANLRTVGIEGLREIIGAGGEALQGLVQMFDMMRELQVNEGLTLLDKNDTFASTAYTFSGLSDMMLQFGQQLSGASGIPLVRLFNQPPAGLSSNSDSDIRMYYDTINARQESKFRNGVGLILQVMWRSTFGKPAPKDLEFTFVALWQMSSMDKATIAKTNTETILGAQEAGVTDRATTMKELRQSSGDSGLFSNITDEQIKEAEEEPPPMPEAETPVVEDPAKTEEPIKNLDHAVKKIKKWIGLK